MGGDVTPPQVKCYSGYQYAERPLAFDFGGQRLEVAVIEAEWRKPNGHGFRLSTKNGLKFELFYDELLDEWQVNPL
ncbi:MAG TPA: hypothetical protein VKF38_09260 [Anaerolineaceae bacterium]|nr:hypothetical protein [Anaerolineaceae bacterium]